MTRGLVTLVCALAACAPRERPPGPPAPPTLSIDEADGGSQGLFHVRGDAPGAAAVRLYASAACHGVPLAVTSPEDFAQGLEVEAVPGPNVFTAVSVGPAGAPSACSAPAHATFTGGGPVDAPHLTSLVPRSPAVATHVVVTGSAPPGCSVVALHAAGCASPAVLAVSAQALEQGVGLDVAPGSISSIVATCGDSSLVRPMCSNALAFVSAPATLPGPSWFGLFPDSPASDPDPQVTVVLSLANAVEVYDGPCDGGLPVGSGGGTFLTSTFPSVTLTVRAALSGAPERTQLWLLTRDEAGDTSECTPGPSYELDPSLPPRATRVSLSTQGDLAQVQIDAQRGGEVDVYLGPGCVGPPAATVVSAGAPQVVGVQLGLPDGGRLGALSLETRFDGGVSPCGDLVP